MHNKIEDLSFFKTLKGLPFIKEIWLYGSRAIGDNSERSDIDLAIYCPKANNKEWLSVIEIIEKADTLLKIDCIRLDSLQDNNPLKQNILSQGIYLYKAHENH